MKSIYYVSRSNASTEDAWDIDDAWSLATSLGPFTSVSQVNRIRQASFDLQTKRWPWQKKWARQNLIFNVTETLNVYSDARQV